MQTGALSYDGVQLLQSARAGVYDTSVIVGETGHSVRTWLTTNGFSCPPSATTVIQDYVDRKWCFLVAKIAPEIKGTVAHHPLKVAFPVKQAIYPVRLTGSDGDPIQLDLYIIADSRASAAGMSNWFSDTYSPMPGEHHLTRYVADVPMIYRAQTESFSRIGQPTLVAMMWPNCVVTRLHGRLDATAMNEDLTLSWIAPEPTRAVLHSRQSALGYAACIAALALAVVFAACTRAASNQAWTWRTMLRRRFGSAALVSTMAAGGWYLTIESVPTIAEPDIFHVLKTRWATFPHREALAHLRAEPSGLPFPEAYRATLKTVHAGELVEEKPILDSPGDYNIETAGHGWRLNVLARDDIPVSILISSNGVPEVRTP
jgi:hypothetical protein